MKAAVQRRKAAVLTKTPTRGSRKITSKRINAMIGTKDLRVTKETKVEAYLVSQVKARRGFVRKVKWVGRRGCPDRYVSIPNVWSGFVELKRPRGGKLSLGQIHEINLLSDAGTRVAIVHSVEEVDQWLQVIGANE